MFLGSLLKSYLPAGWGWPWSSWVLGVQGHRWLFVVPQIRILSIQLGTQT
jgi:hypothetical protein